MLCERTARKLLVKVPKDTARKFLINVSTAKGIPLLSRKLKIGYPRKKLIPFKYPGRRNQIYFKIAQIGTPEKKKFSNQILSRESLFCAKTGRKLSFKASNANGIAPLSRDFRIQYPRNKLSPYKSLVLRKMKLNLF